MAERFIQKTYIEKCNKFMNEFIVEEQIDHALMPRFIFVVEDRYSGVYSDHCFTAWNYGIPIKGLKDPYLGWCYGEPIDSSGPDPDAQTFWNNIKSNPKNWPLYGGGETIKQAVLNFLSKEKIQVNKELFEYVIYHDIQGNNILYTFEELNI